MLLGGLSLLFETIAEVDIVATFTNGADALPLVHQYHADIVVTDAAMSRVDGLEVVRRCSPHVPTLVLTTFDDANLVSSLVAAGTAGYILKDVRPDKLTNAVLAAAAGGLVVDPRIAWYTRQQGELSLLTKTETKVARLVAQGNSNAEIAQALFWLREQ